MKCGNLVIDTDIVELTSHQQDISQLKTEFGNSFVHLSGGDSNIGPLALSGQLSAEGGISFAGASIQNESGSLVICGISGVSGLRIGDSEIVSAAIQRLDEDAELLSAMSDVTGLADLSTKLGDIDAALDAILHT